MCVCVCVCVYICIRYMYVFSYLKARLLSSFFLFRFQEGIETLLSYHKNKKKLPIVFQSLS